MAGYAVVPGFLGAELLVRIDGELAEFTVLSRWVSMASVRTFAGDAPSRAVFYPEDMEYLVAFDDFVTHWEVADTVTIDPAATTGHLGPR